MYALYSFHAGAFLKLTTLNQSFYLNSIFLTGTVIQLTGLSTNQITLRTQCVLIAKFSESKLSLLGKIDETNLGLLCAGCGLQRGDRIAGWGGWPPSGFHNLCKIGISESNRGTSCGRFHGVLPLQTPPQC